MQNIPVRYLGVFLDRALTFKFHVEVVKNRVQQRLKVIHYLAGNMNGGDTTTLKLLYITWIRPIMEYGASSIMSGSQSSLEQLAALQNKALRTIGGYTSTASAAAMHVELGIDTVPNRHVLIAARLSAHIVRRRAPDLLKTMWDGWYQRHTQPPLCHPTSIPSPHMHEDDVLKESSDLTNKTSPWSPPPPTHEDDREVSWPHLGSATSRTTEEKAQARAYSEQVVHNAFHSPSPTLVLFTDGSSIDNVTGGGGAAVVCCKTSNGEKSLLSAPLGKAISFCAEMAAIKLALDWAEISTRNTDSTHPCTVSIISDSQQAVSLAKNAHTGSAGPYWQVSAEIAHSKSRMRTDHHRVRFLWIPGHTDLLENDMADKAAKEAAQRSISLHSSHSDITPQTIPPGKIIRQKETK